MFWPYYKEIICLSPVVTELFLHEFESSLCASGFFSKCFSHTVKNHGFGVKCVWLSGCLPPFVAL